MKKAFIVLVVVFIINIPSLYYGWYIKFSWIDIVLHFWGGFFVAMFMYHYMEDRFRKKEILKNVIIVAGSTVLVGVLWEFAEYIANQTLIDFFYEKFKIRTYFMGDLKDTMGDLLTDTLGGLSFFSLHLLRSRNSH